LSAFDGFTSKAGRGGRGQFEAALTAGFTRLRKEYQPALPQPEKNPAWIGALEELVRSAALDHIRSPRCKLRDWYDERIAADILEETLRELVREVAPEGPTPLALAGWVVKQRPAWRAAWIALGELRLAAGHFEEAMQAARQALSLLGQCPAAQSVLHRACLRRPESPRSVVATGIALQDLSERFCSKPFDTLCMVPPAHEPNAILCNCADALPYPVGQLTAAGSVDAAWNSEAAVEIRRSILDGDFSYCSRTRCPYILGNTLPLKTDVSNPLLRDYIQNRTTVLTRGPSYVQLSYDHSCNLACPSCRTQVLTVNAKQRKTLQRLRDRIILPLLRRLDGVVVISGLGDPFASRHYLSILEALNPKEYRHLKVDLQTNGLLFSAKLWESLQGLQPLVRSIRISIDAAKPETYALVRRPGRWSQLQTSLELISRLRQIGQLRRFEICFVVQKQNFREMPGFVRMGLSLGTDNVRFQKLWNLGSYEPKELRQVDVASPAHPLHQEFLQVLADPILGRPEVDLFSLSPLRKKTGSKAASVVTPPPAPTPLRA
jgi:wyosine [tRNA(Phe)-imidazoG37] synthetase (radical SAM superfamily)